MPEGIGNISQWAGMNSGVDPESLPSNVMWQAMNTISRGGIVRTRPGFKSIYNGPSGWPQGCKFFTTSDNKHYFVFAVGGYVYASLYPFVEYFALPQIKFSPYSLHVTFEICQQSTTYDPDGNFEFLASPVNVLVMQDGRTKAAFWDGSTSRHLNPAKSTGPATEEGKDETPMGVWMSWANDRLWVFRNNLGFASDIGNPLKFTETQYLSEARAFLFPGDVTGSVQPYAASPLIVFTKDTNTQLQAQIRDRSTWAETPNFQQTEYNLGCVSGKSIVKSFGATWWFSEYGVVNLNYALQFMNDSRFQYMDNQMAVSKAYLSPTMNRICAASYENYLLFSVPSGHIYNRHTWVLDQMNTPEGNMAWDSYWTGIRPVEWAVSRIEGRQRAFALSYDADGVTRIWEAFSPNHDDNGCAITCLAESPRYNSGSKNLKKYRHSRVFLDGLVGDTYMSIKVASEHGPYNEVLNKKFVASKGSIADGHTSEIIDFLPQNRRFTTGYLTVDSEDCNSCGIESDEPHDIGTAFSHLFTWSGQAGITGFQMLLEEQATPQDFEADCGDDEVGPKIITAAGCQSVDRDEVPSGFVEYEQTVTSEAVCGEDPSIVGIATATRKSVISQADADAKAACAAAVEADASMYLCGATKLPGDEDCVEPEPPEPPEPPFTLRSDLYSWNELNGDYLSRLEPAGYGQFMQAVPQGAVAFVAGLLGQGADVSLAGGYLAYSTSASMLYFGQKDAFAWNFWWKADSIGAAGTNIFEQTAQGPIGPIVSTPYFRLRFTGADWRLQCMSYAGFDVQDDVVTGLPLVADGNWYMITITHDRRGATWENKIFVNGVAAGGGVTSLIDFYYDAGFGFGPELTTSSPSKCAIGEGTWGIIDEVSTYRWDSPDVTPVHPVGFWLQQYNGGVGTDFDDTLGTPWSP